MIQHSLQSGFYIDRLAAVMMVLITGIGTLITLFSIRYMQQEPGRTRFFVLLVLTTLTLLCMVASANLLMLFICWQLLSLLLPLLSHNYSHPPTVRGTFRTFVILRFGDVAFLAGIVLAYGLYGTLEFQQLFIRAAGNPITFSLFGPNSGIEVGANTAVTLLIFIGAMSKSAQFPLHRWMPDTLYAPTPVSALLHAGIINAGGFLLNRLAPLYGQSPATLHVVFIIGALTTLMGAGMMLTQNDIKKTLVYSTLGQMGYMIMECGLGAFALAIFHLIAHGLFKATLFLNCGNVIHAARHEPRLPPASTPPNLPLERGATPARGGVPSESTDFSPVRWLTGFIATLILPLIILLAAHGLLNIPLMDSQGTTIFLFFAWVTSSQAILTLYRLRAIGSWKVAGVMLSTLVLVLFTYLFAAERFTHFLYPDSGEVAAYFQAAALPGLLFDSMVAATAMAIILGWILIYAKSHGRSLRMPDWVQGLQTRLYLLFMNRLYLDAIADWLGRGLTHAIHRLNTSRLFPYIAGLIALGLVLPPVILAGGMSAEFFRGVRLLALFGALYGSLKALMQVNVVCLLAYAGLVFFSTLGWHIAVTGSTTDHAAVYTGSVVLVIVGLLLTWRCLQTRYGDLDLNQMGGLAQPMPRFAMLLGLLVMAAMGLPPFGLFSGFMGMLLTPPVKMSWDLIVMLLAWFLASWYLFRMMQRLLFGPHRLDIPYEDLRPAEAAPLVIILVLLLALGILPHGSFESDTRDLSFDQREKSLPQMKTTKMALFT